MNMFVVVVNRGPHGNRLVYVGQEGSCELEADRLNEQYQTDEYKVEPWKESI